MRQKHYSLFAAPLLIVSLFGLAFTAPAAAQTPPQKPDPATASLNAKLNAYVGCINDLSARAFDSRDRYFSWAAKSGPTGRENIIYGLYTISDPSGCQKNVTAANAMEPHDADLEAAASAYADAADKLGPLLKQADDYYTQEDYKDDKMAKGRALHPQLVAAWDAFAAADKTLRTGVDAMNDKRALARLAAIESSEGRNAHYHIEAVMVNAKRVLLAEQANKPDVAAMTSAIADYETLVTESDQLPPDAGKIGSLFMSNAKNFLTSAKQLMRRIRDKVPYSSGDMMNLNGPGGWMVEGSPARVLRDYNQLVDSYNMGGRI